MGWQLVRVSNLAGFRAPGAESGHIDPVSAICCSVRGISYGQLCGEAESSEFAWTVAAKRLGIPLESLGALLNMPCDDAAWSGLFPTVS